MGKLHFRGGLVIDISDRALAHLQLVIGTKLRRGESFYFSWRYDQSFGGGRSTVWMQPAIAFHIKYQSHAITILNPRWVDELMSTADSFGGLRLTPEPGPQRTNRQVPAPRDRMLIGPMPSGPGTRDNSEVRPRGIATEAFEPTVHK